MEFGTLFVLVAVDSCVSCAPGAACVYRFLTPLDSNNSYCLIVIETCNLHKHRTAAALRQWPKSAWYFFADIPSERTGKSYILCCARAPVTSFSRISVP